MNQTSPAPAGAYTATLLSLLKATGRISDPAYTLDADATCRYVAVVDAADGVYCRLFFAHSPFEAAEVLTRHLAHHAGHPAIYDLASGDQVPTTLTVALALPTMA